MSADAAPSNPARVLIVDDDEAHAEALADSLELDGYACRLAHSGKEAVELASTSSFERERPPMPHFKPYPAYWEFT